MPRVSRKSLNKNITKELLKQLFSTIGNLKSQQQSEEFLSDLLSETEQLMIAKRLAIAILLFRGKSQTEISHSLSVSFTKTGSVANWLKNAKPSTQALLKKISNQKDWQAFIDKVDTFLDKLPPGKYTDWKKAGKEKHIRAVARSNRKSLR